MSCSTKGNHGIIKFAAAEAGITLTEARVRFHALSLETRGALLDAGGQPDQIVEDPAEYLAFLNTQRRHIQQATNMSVEDKRDALLDVETRIAMVESTGRPLPTKATMNALRALPAAITTQQMVAQPANSRPAASTAAPHIDRTTTSAEILSVWGSGQAGAEAQVAADTVVSGSMRLPRCERCSQSATQTRTYSDGRAHYYCPEHAHGLRRSRNWSEMRPVAPSDLVPTTPSVDPEAALASFLSTPSAETTETPATGNNLTWYEDRNAADGVVRRSQSIEVTDLDGVTHRVEATIVPAGNDFRVEVTVYPTGDSEDLPVVIARIQVSGTIEDASTEAMRAVNNFSGGAQNPTIGVTHCNACGQFLPIDGSGHMCPEWDPEEDDYEYQDAYDDYEDIEGDYEFEERVNGNPILASQAILAFAADPRTADIPDAYVSNYAWDGSGLPAGTFASEGSAYDPALRTTVIMNARIEPLEGHPAGRGYRVVVDSDGQQIGARVDESASFEAAQRIAQEYMARFTGLVENGHAYRCESCGQFLPIDGSSHTCPTPAAPADAHEGGRVREMRFSQGVTTATAYDLHQLTSDLSGGPSAVTDTPQKQIEGYSYLTSATGWMRESLSRLEASLIEKMDAQGVTDLQDSEFPDSTLSIVGGRVWKDWDDDALNPALAQKIGDEVGVSASEALGIITDYNGFAQVSRFRAEPLREVDLRPANFATAEEAPRRVEIRRLPREFTSANASFILSHQETISGKLMEIAGDTYQQQFAEKSLDDAVVEYVRLHQAYRSLRDAEAALEGSAAESINAAGGSITLDDGMTVTTHAGREYRKFDRDQADAQIVDALSGGDQARRGQVEAVVSRYTHFASVTGYRVRAMRAAGIEDSAYSRMEAPRQRIVIGDPEASSGG